VSPHSPLQRRLAGAVLALALVATACSSGGDDTSPAAEGGIDAAPSPSLSEITSEPTASPTPTETETEGLPPIPEAVRGVYTHIYAFWGNHFYNLLDLVRDTELNALVIDVKDEAGTLLWPIDHPIAEQAGSANWKAEGDPRERLQELKDAGGWAIARIACFKDTLVAKARPDLAVQNPDGSTWLARKEFGWLNPYQLEAEQWCIDVALAAIEVGFDEIQFDYIRFPNGGDGDVSSIRFPGVPDDRPRDEWEHPDQIVHFLARAAEQIHAAGGYVSADLFGLVTYDFRWNAGGTGQVLERIAEHMDYISLMVYPSHYARGNYGLLPHPIEYPYETVWNAMQEARMRVQGLRAKIRPWLEDFSAPWMGYPNHTPQHVTEQIRATYENGIEGWLLWNAANRYTESILEPGETQLKANKDFVPPARTANPDAPPGEVEKQWPGMPPCDPYPEFLQIGERNLAGSIPPTPALAYDDPDICANAEDPPSPAATEPTSASSEAPDADG
jgi:hypothetical protein